MGTAAGSVGEKRTHARARALEAGEVAWVAVLPCAAVIVLAILLLGPSLGHTLFTPGSDRFWSEVQVAPEPVEHARFMLALFAGPLVAGAIVASLRWPLRLPPARARVLIAVTQVATVALLALALLAQRDVLFHAYIPPEIQLDLFDVPSLVVAAALALLLTGILGRRRLVERLTRLVRETRARRVACSVLAVLLAILWMASAFNTESTIGDAIGFNLIPWDMSETFAVLNGRTPLVDFHSQYAHLLPYVAAWTMRVVGTSVGGWSGFMVVADGLALLAVYAVFRRIVPSSLLALALFAAFLAGGFSNGGSAVSPVKLFSVWPMRYAGPYVLAWLTARHLDTVAPRRRWLLFVAAALVAINNLEFGLPAFGATLAALVWVDPPRSRRAALRLLGDAGAGLLAAVVLVSALSLVHGGALPRFGLLLEFPRIYGVSGWVLEPMATMGFHIAMYATFVAAIVTATVQAARRDGGPVLTGMLVWSGIFGLGASSYYVGRSDVLNLIALFSAWCFALLLLTVVVVRSLAGARARRPTVADVAVLFGCGLAACAIVQVPLPWTQISRLRQAAPAIFKQTTATRFVARTTTPGEKVAILIPLGHRVAFDAGVADVAPYSGSESIPTVNQMQTTLEAMRSAAVERVYVDKAIAYPGQFRALVRAGWVTTGRDGRYVMLTKVPPSS